MSRQTFFITKNTQGAMFPKFFFLKKLFPRTHWNANIRVVAHCATSMKTWNQSVTRGWTTNVLAWHTHCKAVHHKQVSANLASTATHSSRMFFISTTAPAWNTTHTQHQWRSLTQSTHTLHHWESTLYQYSDNVGKPSTIGQPTRPTQPFILPGSIIE